MHLRRNRRLGLAQRMGLAQRKDGQRFGLVAMLACVGSLLAPGGIKVAFAGCPDSGGWATFCDETSSRIDESQDPNGGSGEVVDNPDEKDYAWEDLDRDGDIDLVAVNKQIGTTRGRRRNHLLMNEGGVLVDRTTLYASASSVSIQGGGTSQGFLDETNDRDVVIVDVDGDGWADVVTATTLSGDLVGGNWGPGDKAISHPRVYINLGEDGGGNWLGLEFDDVARIPSMPAEPRFCSISAGDIDGDGDQDLYLGDYQQPTNQPRTQDLNDRLWINDGSGYFTDESAARMTVEMLESSFAMSTAIADMNGDSRLDIVKDDALNAPQGVSISYNNNAGTPGFNGFFDAYNIPYANTPYHIHAADLNNDTRMDLVITDDGRDYYILNQGNNGSGIATFGARQELIGSVSEFGGNNWAADLDNDGFKDVLVTNVDVDLPSCSTRARIYRNLGDAPNVTITQQGDVGISTTHLTGVHDIAVFDINGDTRPDLVIGRCVGTRVYMGLLPGGCNDDGDCADALFCNGVEQCVGSECESGSDPCPGQLCDEGADACVDCFTNGDCSDGLFCNGVETCVGGSCQAGSNPCSAGLVCNEATNSCDCDDGGDCDDGAFCNGAETCVGGDCQAGSDPCPGQQCNEGSDTCTGCLIDEDCDDGVFCNGAETCDAGSCVGGGDPCPGQLCDEGGDACVDCLVDGDCSDGAFCTGVETCVGGACQSGPGDPCAGGGLTCDEVNDTCVGCLNNGECDDGLFCNGDEVCAGGTCGPAGSGGVLNGEFVDSSNWTNNIPVDGSINYGGSLTVVGPDQTPGSVTWASQSGVDLSGGNLEFDLLSWAPTDEAAWDRPVLHVDGTNYGLDDDGTIGSVATLDNDDFGNIDNENPIGSAIQFVVDVEALAGAGAHTIGFGVLSADGQLGAGTAVFDHVTPAGGGTVDPCPGQLCDEGSDACVECLDAGDCDNGVFCDGAEVCVGGSCQPGTPVDCDDGVDCTVDSCSEGPGCQNTPDDGLCDDGLFCNGSETCDGVGCVAGSTPCAPNEICDEANDECDAVPLAIQPKMGDPLAGLTQNELDRFFVGKSEFDRVFNLEEGLGPVFNQNSCASCHNNPVGGSGGITVTRFGILDEETGDFDDLDEFGGSLQQAQSISIDCAEEVPHLPDVSTAIRSTPSTLGFGLLEAISDGAILANESAPGVSGRAHMVPAFEDPPGSPLRVGRFGWKAQVATVLTFSADAALNEMGITNRFVGSENDPNGINPPSLGAPDNCDTVPDPEDSAPAGSAFIDAVTDFQRFLAPPPQTPRSGMTGEGLFTTLGCADCHTPSYVTGTAPETAITNKLVKPYSDFLLHDMGGLFDGIVQGDAEAGEIRTPPLWGLRVRDPMLHDASVTGGTFATRVVAAIQAHGQVGSEAKPSVDAFLALSVPEQSAVVAFLDSLGRADFDHTGDNLILLDDFVAFSLCFTGPGSFYTADDTCAISDIDQDGDVDLTDFNYFLDCYTGPQQDCNSNSESDLLDILTGFSPDTDQNGIPDECTQSCVDASTCIDNDVCTFDACSQGGTCTHTSGDYADIATQFGCGQDQDVGLFDIFALLDAFANRGDCVEGQADIAGPSGACSPDGDVDLWDILMMLDTFNNLVDCCAPSPTPPSVDPQRQDVSDELRIYLSSTQRVIQTGSTVTIDVFADSPMALRGYELSLDLSADANTKAVLLGGEVDEQRAGYVFAAVESVAVVDDSGGRVAAAAMSQAVSARMATYLGSFTVRVVEAKGGVAVFGLDRDSLVILESGVDATVRFEPLRLDVRSEKSKLTSNSTLSRLPVVEGR